MVNMVVKMMMIECAKLGHGRDLVYVYMIVLSIMYFILVLRIVPCKEHFSQNKKQNELLVL